MGASAIGPLSGRTARLTTFEPPAGYRNSHGYDINDAGQIVGEASVRGTDGFARVPVLWSGGAITVLEPGLYDRMVPAGINASGQIVGTRNGKGFLWQSGTTFDLTGLLESRRGARDVFECGRGRLCCGHQCARDEAAMSTT